MISKITRCKVQIETSAVTSIILKCAFILTRIQAETNLLKANGAYTLNGKYLRHVLVHVSIFFISKKK